MTKPVLILVDDLFWKVRFQETAKGLGVPVVLLSNPEQLASRVEQEAPRLVIVDLGLRKDPFVAVQALKQAPSTQGIRVLGYFEHMRTDLWQRGKEAGFDKLVARSTLTEKLPAWLRGDTNDAEPSPAEEPNTPH